MVFSPFQAEEYENKDNVNDKTAEPNKALYDSIIEKDEKETIQSKNFSLAVTILKHNIFYVII